MLRISLQRFSQHNSASTIGFGRHDFAQKCLLVPCQNIAKHLIGVIKSAGFICRHLNKSLFVFAVCAVATLANAANRDNQIYDESLDNRFGFRDSFAGAAKTKEPEEDVISAIDVVEISSKRVVLPSPKEALTPIHLRRQPQAWSRDSKHI